MKRINICLGIHPNEPYFDVAKIASSLLLTVRVGEFKESQSSKSKSGNSQSRLWVYRARHTRTIGCRASVRR